MWQQWFGRAPAPPANITIVSGLPRSGTSMMMQMLAAGGMDVLTDNIRQADADNPKGYYEFEPVKALKQNPSALDAGLGKACKVISLLLYDLPPDKQYKVVFMQRDLQAVLASQRVMLQHRDPQQSGQTNSDADMARVFRQHVADVKAWLAAQQNIEVIYVDYHDVVRQPAACAKAVNRFLDRRLDEQRMIESVDASLYRHRSPQA